jgi:hypothetical protein
MSLPPLRIEQGLDFRQGGAAKDISSQGLPEGVFREDLLMKYQIGT